MRLFRAYIFAFSLSSALAADYWTTSRIQGTPEPAKPFIAEQVFTGIALHSPPGVVPLSADYPVVR